MDNPGVTHNTNLRSYGASVQAYVETGKIVVDFNGIFARSSPEGPRADFLSLDTEDAERLVAIIEAALADKER